MNMRFPLVVAVVTVAAGVASLRALHSTSGNGTGATQFLPSGGRSVETHATLPGIGTDVSVHRSGASGTELPVPAIGSSFRDRGSSRARPDKIVVYVAGDVAHPGVYALPASARGIDALRAAGGANPGADLVAVNLAQSLADGEEIIVEPKGTAPASGSRRAYGSVASHLSATRKRAKKRRRKKSPAATGYGAQRATDAAADDPPTENVDLNAADASELETLPGIGAALAERIIAFREASGPFASPDDLLDVGGMTQGKLDALLPYVAVR